MFPGAQFVDASRGSFNNVQGDQLNCNINYLVNPDHGVASAAILQRLAHSDMDAYDRSECLTGTRLDVLSFMDDWVKRPSRQHSVLWIHGLAGSGKSAISTTISNRFRELGWLGAFVFFDRDVIARSDPATVIQTLAYQLGTFHASVGIKIAAAIKSTPSICHASIRLQFQKLVIEPLSSIQDVSISGPIVLVLDALDECGSARERKNLLTVLAEDSANLPSTVCMIMTTRADFDIRCALESQDHVYARELDIASESNAEDILLYLRYRMAGVRRANRYLPLDGDWPGDDNIGRLAKQAHGLFVWARIASEFINGHDPRKRLNTLLIGQQMPEAESALDSLYQTALEHAGRWDDPDFVTDFQAILGVVLATKDCLSVSAIDSLLYPADGRPSIHTISLLGCVLYSTPIVRVLHPSFVEFLSNKERCRKQLWFIDLGYQHIRLAALCLDRLTGVLRRNICNLTLSSNVIKGSLPEDVSYACIFWIEHIELMGGSVVSVAERVDTFLHLHLLHWLEAMSILHCSRRGPRLLQRLLHCIQTYLPSSTRLSRLVADGCRFAQAFMTSMEEHPLLIYLTALPFTPIDSILYKTFHDKETFPWIAGGFEKAWSPLEMQLHGHSDGVLSVAFSPDGTRIVSGSLDCSVRIWDVASGEEVCPPFLGHTLSVTSVAYSPDGRQIVSASFDGTVGVWDVRTGAVLRVRPVPAGWVNSACFSPDGKRVISGSEVQTDVALGPNVIPPLRGRGGSNTIGLDAEDLVNFEDLLDFRDPAATRMSNGNVCIWDAASGKNVAPPLCGHGGPIHSIAVSPDGTQIASSSQDGTLRMWNENSGKALAPFTGHTGVVFSVAFSPDGTLITSGSSDSTVRIWNTQTGQEVRPPLCGHTACVTSVCFSPDGMRIVSGSDDTTIRIWSAQSGVADEEFLPLFGHGGGISSVAFSPDGKHIVSGSRDSTIRIWDAASLKKSVSSLTDRALVQCVQSLAFSPDGTRVACGAGRDITLWDTVSGAHIYQLRGHQGPVLSVTFSPDGQYIASGSEDKTVRVWNAQTGLAMPEPLQGHRHPITSLTYTPDGFYIVSASDDRVIHVWNASSNAMVMPAIKGHPKWVPFVAIHLNPVRIAAALNGDVLHPSELATTYSFASIVDHDDIQVDAFVPRHVGSGWIMDMKAYKNISKLPSSMSVNTVTKSTSLGRSIAIGTRSGQVVIMHFPPAICKIGVSKGTVTAP